ncbi:hypothetical protein OAO28_02100 [Candidatus Pelagibacter sp.]|jgi:hypothetical protein|nr:hypothetical protein [Candidatus Pelagibacter sp.]
MKINNQDLKLYNKNLNVKKFSSLEKTVTTDINILLNRVRLDEKKDLKKRLIFLGLMLSIISFVTIFAIV